MTDDENAMNWMSKAGLVGFFLGESYGGVQKPEGIGAESEVPVIWSASNAIVNGFFAAAACIILALVFLFIQARSAKRDSSARKLQAPSRR